MNLNRSTWLDLESTDAFYKTDSKYVTFDKKSEIYDSLWREVPNFIGNILQESVWKLI